MTADQAQAANTAISADGTAIAFDWFGDGPPVLMAAGAFNMC